MNPWHHSTIRKDNSLNGEHDTKKENNEKNGTYGKKTEVKLEVV